MNKSIQSHHNFFERIVKMIPLDIYKPNTTNVEDEVSVYYKHMKKPLAPDQKKQLSKKKRQEKYSIPVTEMNNDDTETLKPVCEVVVEETIPDSAESYISEFESHGTDALDKLRRRLQARILNFRVDRKKHTSKIDKVDNSAKITNVGLEPESITKHTSNVIRDILIDTANVENKKSAKTVQNKSSSLGEVEDLGDVEFSIVDRTDKKKSAKDVGKSGTKLRRLKRMLAEAENKRKRLDDLKAQGDLGLKRYCVKTSLYSS